MIKADDKILIIAPHPDDEVIACGGFIAKYHNNIDILCVSASGVKYTSNKYTAEEIAQIRMEEFYDTAKLAQVNKVYIEKIYGVPPHLNKIENAFNNYIAQFSVKDYDYILIPHKDDAHIEHRYAGNVLLKKMLELQGYKPNLKILRYEIWSPLSNANYFEDITDVVEDKKRLILNYKIRTGKNYLDKILALNKYRTLSMFFGKNDKYVEAFYLEDVDIYLKKPDIINKNTQIIPDKNICAIVDKINIQDRINKIADIYKNKRIALYGAGKLAQFICKNYDLSALNIIAVADLRFEKDIVHKFFNYKTIKPLDLIDLDCDLILISNYEYKKFYNILKNKILLYGKNKNIEIAPFINC
ncbi:MAG: PIG-L family deacetylase [Candidatus Gastranaerophilales bacterium]|nr:PIG-L family deacetylase [Candidatus Gastranaerophilales bacterium]